MFYRYTMALMLFVALGLSNAFAQDAVNQEIEQNTAQEDTIVQENVDSGVDANNDLSGVSHDQLSDIQFFQFSFKDGAIASTAYVDAGVGYYDYDYGSSYLLGARAGVPVSSRLQIDGEINLVNWDSDYADQEAGVSDLLVSVKYLVLEPGSATFGGPHTNGLQVTAGGYCTLPVGSEDIEQGNFNTGIYSAARYPFEFGMTLAANVGFDYIETDNASFTTDDYELSLSLGVGAIYPVNDELNVIGEIHKRTEVDYLLASAGADYRLGFGGHVRAAMGVGLQDSIYGPGSSDFMFTGRFMYPF